jgi:anti-anti-sigma factor
MGSATLSHRRRNDGTIVLEIAGELDIDSEAGLASALFDLATNIRPPCIVVDFGRVTAMEAGGIDAIMDGYRAANASLVGFLVRDVRPPVAAVLQRAGVYRALTGGA